MANNTKQSIISAVIKHGITLWPALHSEGKYMGKPTGRYDMHLLLKPDADCVVVDGVAYKPAEAFKRLVAAYDATVVESGVLTPRQLSVAARNYIVYDPASGEPAKYSYMDGYYVVRASTLIKPTLFRAGDAGQRVPLTDNELAAGGAAVQTVLWMSCAPAAKDTPICLRFNAVKFLRQELQFGGADNSVLDSLTDDDDDLM